MDRRTFSAEHTGRHWVGAIAASVALLLAGAVPAMAAASGSIATPIPSQVQAGGTGVKNVTVAQLLAAALHAYTSGRLVDPTGDNAVEYYEAALRTDPNNHVARDALRESFSYAAAQVEQTIADNHFDEANREIGLLVKADPTNYTLTILRAKLKARQKLSGGQHVLILRASENSWVEITNTDGHVVDSRVLHADESRSYQSSRPLRVTLGNADGVKVSADGKDIKVNADLHAKVAHLELFASKSRGSSAIRAKSDADQLAYSPSAAVAGGR